MATQIYPGVFTPTQKNFEVQAQTKAKRYLDTYTDAKYEAWQLSLAQAEKKLAQEMSLFEAKQKAKLDMLQQLNDRQMLYEKQLQDLTDAKLSADEKEQVYNANAQNDQKSLEYKELSANARADAAGKNRASRSNNYVNNNNLGYGQGGDWEIFKAGARGAERVMMGDTYQQGLTTIQKRANDVDTGNAVSATFIPILEKNDAAFARKGAVAGVQDRIDAGVLNEAEVSKVAKMTYEEARKLGYTKATWIMYGMWFTNKGDGSGTKKKGTAVATPVVAPEPYDPSLIDLSTLPADEREAYLRDQIAAVKYERDAIQYELNAMQDPNSDVIGEARGIYKEKFVRPNAKITQAQLDYLPKFIAKGLRELPLTATAAEKAQAEEQATKIWATWVATGKLPTSTKVPMGNELVDSEAGVDLRPTVQAGSTEVASQQAASTGDSSQSVQSVQPTQAQPVIPSTPYADRRMNAEPTEVIDLTGSGTTGGAANNPAPAMNPEVQAILQVLGVEPDADVARLGTQPDLSNVQPVPSTYNVNDSNIDPRITGTAQPVQPQVVAPQATTVATPYTQGHMSTPAQPVQSTQPQMPPVPPTSSPVAPQVVAPSQPTGTQPEPATALGTNVQPQGTGTSRGSTLGQSILNAIGSVPASGTVKGITSAVPSLSAGVGSSPVSVPNAMGSVPDASTVKGVEASVPSLGIKTAQTLPSLPVQTKVPEAGKSAKSVYVPAKAVMRALSEDSDTLDLSEFMQSEMNAPDEDIEYGDNTDALDEVAGDGIILGTDRKIIDGMYEEEVQYKQTPDMVEKSNAKQLPIDEEDVKDAIKKNDMGGATNKTIDDTLKTEAVLAGRQLAGRPKKLERVTLNTDYGMFTKKMWDMNKSSDTPKTVNELRGELAKVYMNDPVKQNKAITTLYAIDMAANDMSKQRLV